MTKQKQGVALPDEIKNAIKDAVDNLIDEITADCTVEYNGNEAKLVKSLETAIGLSINPVDMNPPVDADFYVVIIPHLNCGSPVNTAREIAVRIGNSLSDLGDVMIVNSNTGNTVT